MQRRLFNALPAQRSTSDSSEELVSGEMASGELISEELELVSEKTSFMLCQAKTNKSHVIKCGSLISAYLLLAAGSTLAASYFFQILTYYNSN